MSEESNSQQARTSGDLSLFYPEKIAKRFLYAIGGKGTNVVMKTIERYDIERDEWVQVKI